MTLLAARKIGLHGQTSPLGLGGINGAKTVQAEYATIVIQGIGCDEAHTLQVVPCVPYLPTVYSSLPHSLDIEFTPP